jgi:hypothetical protein
MNSCSFLMNRAAPFPAMSIPTAPGELLRLVEQDPGGEDIHREPAVQNVPDGHGNRMKGFHLSPV